MKAWEDTQRIAVGGGLRASRVGELAIGRAAVLVKSGGRTIDLVPIRHHPDWRSLIGCVHLAPSWLFKPKSAMLAVDIGGSNIRAGCGGDSERPHEKPPSTRRSSGSYAQEDPRPKREEADRAAFVEDVGRLIKAADKASLDAASA